MMMPPGSVLSIRLYSHQGLGCGGPPINLTCVWGAFSDWTNSFVAFWDYHLSINTDQYILHIMDKPLPCRSNGKCNWNLTKQKREMKIKATFLFANQKWGDAFGSFDGITCAGHKNVPDTSFLCKLMEKRRDKVPNILSSWTNIPRQRKHTFHPNNNGKLCTCSVHDPLGQWGPSEAIFCHNDNTIRAGGSAAT